MLEKKAKIPVVILFLVDDIGEFIQLKRVDMTPDSGRVPNLIYLDIVQIFSRIIELLT